MALDTKDAYNYIVVIQDTHFEWSKTKDASNQKKHGIAFEEAATVFSDFFYLEIADLDHSEIEERFIALGLSDRIRLLVVCHSILADDKTVRIISARKATSNEERQYGEKTNERRI